MLIIALSQLGAPPTLASLVPCTEGLAIEYVVREGGEAVAEVTETVAGPGQERRTCVLDKRTVRPDGSTSRDVWAREILDDRVANAGWVDQPLAFRPILIKMPLVRGHRWRFNETFYEITAVQSTVTVAAGRFEGCVVVHERLGDHAASTTYAPGVGVIRWTSKSQTMEATAVKGKPVSKPPDPKARRRQRRRGQ